jgi:hypothetical protein
MTFWGHYANEIMSPSDGIMCNIAIHFTFIEAIHFDFSNHKVIWVTYIRFTLFCMNFIKFVLTINRLKRCKYMDETFSNSLRLQTRLIGSIFDVSPENMLNVLTSKV